MYVLLHAPVWHGSMSAPGRKPQPICYKVRRLSDGSVSQLKPTVAFFLLILIVCCWFFCNSRAWVPTCIVILLCIQKVVRITDKHNVIINVSYVMCVLLHAPVWHGSMSALDRKPQPICYKVRRLSDGSVGQLKRRVAFFLLILIVCCWFFCNSRAWAANLHRHTLVYSEGCTNHR